MNPALSGTVNSLVDFLLGLPVNVQVAQNGPDGKPFGHHYGGYIQDDWKVTRNLTFNLGLRYEVNPAFDDETNQLGNFDRFYPGGRIVAQDLSLINPSGRLPSAAHLLSALPRRDCRTRSAIRIGATFNRGLALPGNR